MLEGGAGDISASGLAEAQRVAQLIQEERHTVFDLGCCGWRNRACGYLRSTAADDLFAVKRNELVQHDLTFAIRTEPEAAMKDLEDPTIDDQPEISCLIVNSSPSVSG